jgi:hypothetical protein
MRSETKVSELGHYCNLISTIYKSLYRLLQISPFQNANTGPRACPEVHLEVSLRGVFQHPL